METLKTPPQVVPYMPVIPGLQFYATMRASGEYYGALGAAGPITPITMVADKLYCIPFLVLKTETFNGIAIDVQTLSAGNARLGIYNDNGACAPGTLLVDAGAVDTGTTGAKEIVINQSLQPGLYWLAAIFNATPKVYGPTTIPNLLGLKTPSVASCGCYSWYYTTQVYGELPTPHPAPTLYGSSPCGISLKRA